MFCRWENVRIKVWNNFRTQPETLRNKDVLAPASLHLHGSHHQTVLSLQRDLNAKYAFFKYKGGLISSAYPENVSVQSGWRNVLPSFLTSACRWFQSSTHLSAPAAKVGGSELIIKINIATDVVETSINVALYSSKQVQFGQPTASQRDGRDERVHSCR